jgi:hypothetical protein
MLSLLIESNKAAYKWEYSGEEEEEHRQNTSFLRLGWFLRVFPKKSLHLERLTVRIFESVQINSRHSRPRFVHK